MGTVGWDGPAIVWGFWLMLSGTWKCVGFFSMHIHMSVYIYLAMPKPIFNSTRAWDWQSDTFQTGFVEVYDVVLTWINQDSLNNF